MFRLEDENKMQMVIVGNSMNEFEIMYYIGLLEVIF